MPRKKPEKSLSKKMIPKVVIPEVLDRAEPRSKRREFDDENLEDGVELNESGEDSENEEVDPPSEDDEGSENSESTALAVTSIDRELRAVSPTDPLRRYLDEVRAHPLLTPEEEIRLVLKLQNEGDINSAKKLVQANLRLVVKIALEYRSVYANVMDLIQEGNVGLMKAVSKYDPTKGARLGYYSSWWIRSYILKYLLDNFRLVRVGTTQAQKKLFFHLMREKDRLEAQGIGFAPKLLAEKLHVREKDVIEMEQRLSSSGSEVSLDAPMRAGEESGSFMELLPDDHEGADDRIARNQLLKLLSDQLPEFEKTLNDKEKQLLRNRLLAEDPKTLQEVADLYGLTRERARQIETKVIDKLRSFLAPNLK